MTSAPEAPWENSQRHRGKASRGNRLSKYINKRQAVNLFEALQFSEMMGRPLNVSVDICWLMFSGTAIHDKAIMIQAAYNPLGKLRYNLKGVDPKHASGFGIRPAYQGELSGKRAGCTQNLSASARHKATTREDDNPSS